MAGDGAVAGLGGPGADHHLGGDHAVAVLPGPAARHPQGAAGAQAGDQLAFQRPAALDVEGLADRLVRHAHGLIIGEAGPQPAGDLLRAPAGRPAPVLARPVAAAAESGRRPGAGLPSGVRIIPASRSCTYSRNRSLAASFEILGRRARRSACHRAVVAR
jgi:hypothetical protein